MIILTIDAAIALKTVSHIKLRSYQVLQKPEEKNSHHLKLFGQSHLQPPNLQGSASEYHIHHYRVSAHHWERKYKGDKVGKSR